MYEPMLWILTAAFVAAGLWADYRTTRRLLIDGEARIAELRVDLTDDLLRVSTIGGRQRERASDIVAGLDAGEAVAA